MKIHTHNDRTKTSKFEISNRRFLIRNKDRQIWKNKKNSENANSFSIQIEPHQNWCICLVWNLFMTIETKRECSGIHTSFFLPFVLSFFFLSFYFLSFYLSIFCCCGHPISWGSKYTVLLLRLTASKDKWNLYTILYAISWKYYLSISCGSL